MKVISKPKLPIQTCKKCGSVIKVGYKDLKYDGYTLMKNSWYCPVCNYHQYIDFKEKDS